MHPSCTVALVHSSRWAFSTAVVTQITTHREVLSVASVLELVVAGVKCKGLHDI